jgi:hypothetical protein
MQLQRTSTASTARCTDCNRNTVTKSETRSRIQNTNWSEKKLVDNIAKQEMRSWQQHHVRAAGRVAAYAAIRHEAPGVTLEYLSHPALSKHERRNTACMRTQCASYVAAHAQHRNTAMFGPPVTHARRHCQCGPCKHTNTTDSTAHVMLHCAAHATDRREMTNSVNHSPSIAATKNRGRHVRSLDALAQRA